MAIAPERPRIYEGTRIPSPIPTVLAVDPETRETGDILTVNFGPNHPSTHGVLRLVVDLDGERVVGLRAVVGYLHTGFEKNMEQKTWWKAITYPERIDYVSFQNNEHDFCVVPTGAYLDRAKVFKAPILEPGLLVYGPLAIMLNEFEIHNFPAVAVLPYAEPARADPAAAALAIREIAKAYNFRVEVDELVKDAKFIEREFTQKSRLTRKSLQRMYA